MDAKISAINLMYFSNSKVSSYSSSQKTQCITSLASTLEKASISANPVKTYMIDSNK